MASGKATIELNAKQQALVQRQLKSGYYQSVDEVIGDALRALDERGAVYDDFLRAKVRASLASKKPSVPIDAAFKRARAAIARKAKAAKRGA